MVLSTIVRIIALEMQLPAAKLPFLSDLVLIDSPHVPLVTDGGEACLVSLGLPCELRLVPREPEFAL